MYLIIHTHTLCKDIVFAMSSLFTNHDLLSFGPFDTVSEHFYFVTSFMLMAWYLFNAVSILFHHWSRTYGCESCFTTVSSVSLLWNRMYGENLDFQETVKIYQNTWLKHGLNLIWARFIKKSLHYQTIM